MRHPLSALKTTEPQDENSIRYLTFGSASALGEGLEDSGQAYPYLLSPNVHNVASRARGSSLSAICTQSIVGEGNYDVILMEFVDDDAEGIIHLAERIRRRFPNARLVFVRLWSPATHILYKREITAQEWWKQQLQQQQQAANRLDNESDEEEEALFFHSFEFESAVLQTDPNDWSFVDQSEDALMIDVAISEVGGSLIPLPFPELETAASVLTQQRYMNMFQEANPTLLSEMGHQRVAQGIRSLLTEEDENAILNHPGRNTVGSWGAGDDCSMWYASGDYTSLRSRRRANLVDFSKGDDGVHRHAVEISRRGGSIDVVNASAEPRMLYLTYMTASENDDKKGKREYPRTKIGLGGKPTVMIDPIHHLRDSPTKENDGDHLTRTTAVGMVPPGNTVLTLKPVDKDSKGRFRLVGLHFLNKGKVPIPFEFALEPEPAHR